jgi:hypothetical protein
MALDPIRPLRFYELWMLKFLSRSPRIHRVIVEQEALPLAPGSPEAVAYLDACYRAK